MILRLPASKNQGDSAGGSLLDCQWFENTGTLKQMPTAVFKKSKSGEYFAHRIWLPVVVLIIITAEPSQRYRCP